MSESGPTVTNDEVIAGAAILAGIASNRFIDVGSGIVPNMITFFVGAVPMMLATETALNDDGLNLELIQRSINFMWLSPGTFGVITIGIISGLSIAYNLLLSEEVLALEALVPFFRTQNVDLAIVILGGFAALVFGGICGWTIDVIEWVIAGSESSQIPGKPGGRVKWGIEDLPKDIGYLVFAVPIGIFEQFTLSIQKVSIVPFLMTPLKIAVDQWTRLGDILIDLQNVEKIAGVVLKDGWKCFDDLCHKLADNSGFVLGITFPKGSYTTDFTHNGYGTSSSSSLPKAQVQTSLSHHHSQPTPPPTPPTDPDDVYGALRAAENNGNVYHFHPQLYETEPQTS